MMRGFSTKYALTKGIEEVEVNPSLSGDAKYVYCITKGYPTQLVVGRDFFEDRGAAERDARRRATEKIASLERQIARLVKKMREWS